MIGLEDESHTSHPKIIRALPEVPNTTSEARVDELIQLVQVQQQDKSLLRKVVVDLVPDFNWNSDNSPLNVLPRASDRVGLTGHLLLRKGPLKVLLQRNTLFTVKTNC